MRTKEWLAMVERKSESLHAALKRAYLQAAGFESDEWQEEVLLHDNGNITIFSNKIYCLSPHVLNGDAIYIGTIKWFDEAKEPDLLATAEKWASEQLELALRDLRYTAEFEELHVMPI